MPYLPDIPSYVKKEDLKGFCRLQFKYLQIDDKIPLNQGIEGSTMYQNEQYRELFNLLRDLEKGDMLADVKFAKDMGITVVTTTELN